MTLIYLLLVSVCGAYEKNNLDAMKSLWSTYGFALHNDPAPRQSETPYLDGSINERYADLCQQNESMGKAQIMIAVRGGYGALHFFDRSVEEQNSSMLLGYSDVSIIHLQRFYQKEWIGIHGPNFLGIDKQQEHPAVIATLRNLILGKAAIVSYPRLQVLHGEGNREGNLIVMNLSSLQSVIGLIDPSFFAGKILAIEDINEPLYKIDRMMTQLAHAGFLEKLSGLVLGQFHHGERLLNNQDIWQQSIKPLYLQNRYKFPVYDWPIFGHGTPNMPLLFGAPVRIEKALDSDGEHYLHYNINTP